MEKWGHGTGLPVRVAVLAMVDQRDRLLAMGEKGEKTTEDTGLPPS